jgi:protoheme IX farnesyltransferase
MFKTFYKLAKPGIVYGNAVAAIGGFFLAQTGNFKPGLFLAMLFGVCLIMASACVFNNIMDINIDRQMDRTKNRAMVLGKISKRYAIIFGISLGIFGALVLGFFVNLLSLYVALVGFIFYVCLYTPLKTKTVYATLIGAVSGAVPPVVGYTAVINKIDTAAVLLFFILVFWQMPHFYAIGIRRLKDYTAAKIPILPVAAGVKKTKIHIIFYLVGFLILCIGLTFFGYTGYNYLVIMLGLGLWWIKIGRDGFRQGIDNELWAKKLFKFSLVVLMVFCVIISVDKFLK